MKKLLLLIPLTFLSVHVQAQQVSEYQICTRYREVYAPGYYDQNGNYMRGSVYTSSYRVACGVPISASYAAPAPVVYYQQQRVCDPQRTAMGALLGGSIAGAISGKGYQYGGSYSNTYAYGRGGGSNSGSWNRYDKPNYWVGLGAAVGGLAYSC